MEKYYIKRFNTFKSCLYDFAKAKQRDYKNDTFVLSGVVSKYCLTFDLSWKLMKDIIREYHGIDDYALGSPRENLEAAFKCHLIDDDKRWIDMLRLRNKLTHDYNSELAYESCDTIVNEYIDFFINFQNSIEKYINRIKED